MRSGRPGILVAMAAEDLFKRYLEVGASMLNMSRERAESIVADLVASGEVARGQATRAADWMVERGRAGTEELAEMIRREIRQQVSALGLATREDVARLEARLDATTAAGPAAVPPMPATPTPRKRTAPSGKAEAASADSPAHGPAGAGITRSGSVKGRSAAPGPAGEAEPPGD